MSEPKGPFSPGQRVWDGDYLHEIVAAMPGARWSDVYTRIVMRRKDNVLRPAQFARSGRPE